ncbi:MAG: lysophospholipid acyltransferase family protein [Geminicoccaceae bacterium]|nr:lysophospholipid acyltransferase family protein [Geminicoccaceae bacterium]
MARTFILHRGKKERARQPWLTDTLVGLEASLLRALWWCCGRLGPDRGGDLGAAVVGAIGPHLSKSTHLARNLAVALPDLDEARRAGLVRAAWGEIGRVIGEIPSLGVLSGAEAAARFEVIEHYDMDAVRRGERRAVFVSGHFANWELAAGCSHHVGFPLAVVYSPQANTGIDAALQAHREGLGVEMIQRQNAARGMLRAIQRGLNVGVLLDQRYDEGEPVPFFGHPTPSGLAPAMLALKLGIDYVPMRVERLNKARFRFTFHDAVEPDPGKGDARAQALDMTARAYAHFEQWIRERPEQWLCLKRRWPRKVYEQLGLRP